MLDSELNPKGNIPVYSANVKKPFGFIDKEILKDYTNESVLWGIDGDWDQKEGADGGDSDGKDQNEYEDISVKESTTQQAPVVQDNNDSVTESGLPSGYGNSHGHGGHHH